jgi:hypothetical protein
MHYGQCSYLTRCSPSLTSPNSTLQKISIPQQNPTWTLSSRPIQLTPRCSHLSLQKILFSSLPAARLFGHNLSPHLPYNLPTGSVLEYDASSSSLSVYPLTWTRSSLRPNKRNLSSPPYTSTHLRAPLAIPQILAQYHGSNKMTAMHRPHH